MKDIPKDIQLLITERLSSPLSASFTISWCLWNYKVLVILLSVNTVSMTFKLIEKNCFPTTASILINGIGFPLLIALVYLFVYPYPAKFVYEFTRKRQKEIHEIKQRIEDETPLTLEESRAIRAALRSQEDTYSNDMQRKEKEIHALKEEILALRPPSPEIPIENEIDPTKKYQPNSEQIKLLAKISNSKDDMPEEVLIANTKDTRTKVLFDLGELEKHKFVRKIYRGREYLYDITHLGRTCVVENAVDLVL
ncbi:MAG: hypothetical protein V4447_14755 [Pseudomonadota bacterium]